MAAVRAELVERSSIGLRLRDRYRIVSPLGRGTLGEVSVAEDEVTGERVAVRLLPRELSPEAVQRSRRSIIAASAAHPAFVRVLDSGETSDGRSFMVMELAEGRGLHEILAENEPLEVSEALRLALDLGGAVETLHNLGTVHAGLRPCNVRLLPEGRVKLMDLEIAGLRGAPELHELQGDGAPADYLAPEQIRGDPVSDKTDVYAFGLTLYELLCGVPPFRNDSREATLSAQLDDTPPRLRRRRRGIPKGVQALVSRALAKQPEPRPFMSNLLNDLDDAASRPVTSWQRVAAVVGGVLIVAAMAIPLVWDVFTPRPDAAGPVNPPAGGRHAGRTAGAPVVRAARSSAAGGRDAVGARRDTPGGTRAASARRNASRGATARRNASRGPPPPPAATLPAPEAPPRPAVVIPAPPRPAVTLPPAPARETPPPSIASPPPPRVAPSPSPVPASPPAPERRAPAPPRVDARPAPERSTSAPERPAVAPQRPASPAERPATGPERDDPDGGAAVDWLLNRPGR